MTHAPRDCDGCGTTFTPRPKAAAATQRFCSRLCQRRWRARENSPLALNARWAAQQAQRAEGPLRVVHRRTRGDGYVVVTLSDGRRMLEHRWIVEQRDGLEPTEVVHHLDENPSNNHPDNLERERDQAAHMAHHGRRCEPGCTCRRHDSSQWRRAS